MKNNRHGGVIRKTNNAAGNTSVGIGGIRKNKIEMKNVQTSNDGGGGAGILGTIGNISPMINLKEATFSLARPRIMGENSSQTNQSFFVAGAAPGALRNNQTYSTLQTGILNSPGGLSDQQ